MHLDGTHLFGDVLARALYQPLAQVGGELRPCVGGDINAAVPSEPPMLAATSLTASSPSSLG